MQSEVRIRGTLLEFHAGDYNAILGIAVTMIGETEWIGRFCESQGGVPLESVAMRLSAFVPCLRVQYADRCP